MISVLILGLLASISSQQTIGLHPALQFKSFHNFKVVYTDYQTGSNQDLSIWRLDQYPQGYYSVGDLPIHGYLPPTTGYVVKELESGALAKPVRYQQIWSDVGSGGFFNVKFWRPIPPEGYICLGDVAVASYIFEPFTNWIRCLRKDLVGLSNRRQIWNDKGSGADKDVSIWEAVAFHSQTLAVETMIAVPGYSSEHVHFWIPLKSRIRII